MSSEKKKYLVKFNCIIGEYEHITSYVFDKQMSEYQYCKKFWGLSKKICFACNNYCFKPLNN